MILLLSLGMRYKKKGEEALGLKTDSFVFKSNVHFSTDFPIKF